MGVIKGIVGFYRTEQEAEAKRLKEENDLHEGIVSKKATKELCKSKLWKVEVETILTTEYQKEVDNLFKD